MIYSIIGINEIPLMNMHIYLQNETGNDGGKIPELFDSLALTETVNGGYAFAVGAVMTNNFTNMKPLMANHPTLEVAILALVQLLKGMASTFPLKNECVSRPYMTLKDADKLGCAPSILNLDGEFFGGRHYDREKYGSAEDADRQEDSFPYWVINTIHLVEDSTELKGKAKNIDFKLPYFIQNISNSYIPIFSKPGGNDADLIGELPPTGMEPIIEIRFGYGRLATSKSAWIQLKPNELIPVKHLESLNDIKGDTKGLMIPAVPFGIEIKKNVVCTPQYGITDHYLPDEEHTFIAGDRIWVEEVIFDSYAVLYENEYLLLSSDYVRTMVDGNYTDMMVEPIQEETKEEMEVDYLDEKEDVTEDMVVSPIPNPDDEIIFAENHITNIMPAEETTHTYETEFVEKVLEADKVDIETVSEHEALKDEIKEVYENIEKTPSKNKELEIKKDPFVKKPTVQEGPLPEVKNKVKDEYVDAEIEKYMKLSKYKYLVVFEEPTLVTLAKRFETLIKKYPEYKEISIKDIGDEYNRCIVGYTNDEVEAKKIRKVAMITGARPYIITSEDYYTK